MSISHICPCFRPLALALALPISALAAEPGGGHTHSRHEGEVDWLRGENMSLGGWLVPEVHVLGTIGASTADDPSSLAVGHHDPDRERFRLQAFEVTLTGEFSRNLTAMATYAAQIDLDDRWSDEFEEYYLKVHNLPLGIEVRAGLFFTRFGWQNELHAHDFDWADQYLANGRYLGEDPVTIYGGEVSAPILRDLPTGWSDRLTVSYGAVPDEDEHAHAHAHGDSEGGDESEFNAESALFDDWTVNVDYTARYEHSRQHAFGAGVSAAIGRNRAARQTQVYGLHLEYLWTENGRDEPGRYLRWRTELFLRHFGAVSRAHAHAGEAHGHGVGDGELHEEGELEHAADESDEHAEGHETEHDEEGHEHEHEEGHEGREEGESEVEPLRRTRRDFTDFGFYTSVTYGFTPSLEAGVRAEYTSGIGKAGVDERWRLSSNVTWRPTSRADLRLRLQYNYDHFPARGSEHSVWAQFALAWGCQHHH